MAVFPHLPARDPRRAIIRSRIFQIRVSEQQRPACRFNAPRGGVQAILAFSVMPRDRSWGISWFKI